MKSLRGTVPGPLIVEQDLDVVGTIAGDAVVRSARRLHVRGAISSTRKFPSALSAGSAHADWFSAMLPDVLDAFRHPARGRVVFEEAAETLSVISRAYDAGGLARRSSEGANASAAAEARI